MSSMNGTSLKKVTFYESVENKQVYCVSHDCTFF